MMKNISINIDFNKQSRPFKHFYRATGYANTDYTYTAPTLRMYDHLSSFHNHLNYMRLHNILTSHGRGDHYFIMEGMDYGSPNNFIRGVDKVVSINESGQLEFNWEIVDKVYDIFVEHGIKAIVETVYMPSALRPPESGERRDAPTDYKLWGKVVEELVRHLVDRYGREEISQWYFEVWNEPDGKGAFRKGEPLHALYDYMAEGVKKVDPAFRVGGPATMQNQNSFDVFERFLTHCSKGVNYATGKAGSPLDFISVHCKGGNPWGTTSPSTQVMFSSIKRYIEIIRNFPEFESLEFFNDESDIVWAGNIGCEKHSWLNFRNTHYFPGFVCKMVDTYCMQVEDQEGMNLAIVDSDNCHLQWERSLFSGNRSQFTPLIEYGSTDLLKKPAFNAYVLLSRLRYNRVPAECEHFHFGKHFGALPTFDDKAISVMVWNFEDGTEDGINDRTIRLRLGNIPQRGKFRMIHYRIDEKSSSSYSIWKELGKPTNPGIDEIKKIREHEGLELAEAVENVEFGESFEKSIEMPMHSVSLLLFVPESSSAPAKPKLIKAEAEVGWAKNHQVFLKWKPNSEVDFFHYKIYRSSNNEEEDLIYESPSLNTSVYIDMSVKSGMKYMYRVSAVNASGIEGEKSEAGEVTV